MIVIQRSKGTCAYGGERRACCVVYKVPLRLCISAYVGNTQNTPKKRRQQNFQDVAQKVQHDKNPDSFAAHFAQHFNQKPTPQQCLEIMKPEILSTVKFIGSLKTWSKYSCKLCMKEILGIISRSRHRYRKLINACSELYGACHHKSSLRRSTLT